MYIVFCILCYRLQLYRYTYPHKLKYGIYYVHKYACIYVLQKENSYTIYRTANIHFAYPIFFFSAIVFICQLSLDVLCKTVKCNSIYNGEYRKYGTFTPQIQQQKRHNNLMTKIFISSTVLGKNAGEIVQIQIISHPAFDYFPFVLMCH